MPHRKLLSDGDGGYGWEGDFNAVLRMSVAAMWTTNVKNERERFLHRKTLAQIADDRRDAIHSMNRSLIGLRRELTDMTAHMKVYRQNSLTNWEKRKPNLEHRQEDTKENTALRLPGIDYSTCKTDVDTANPIHPAILWRKGRDPLLKMGDIGKSPNHQSVHGFRVVLKVNERDDKKLPNPTQSRGDQSPTRDKHPNKGRGKINRSVNVRKPKLRERENEKVSAYLPPGCKGVFFIHRFIEKEAKGVLLEMDPSYLRKKRAEKLVKTVKMPVLIDRKRTTSAILHDFNSSRRGCREIGLLRD